MADKKLKQVDLPTIKTKIRNKITALHECNVAEFSKKASTIKLLGKGGAKNLPTYLSDSDKTSISLSVFQKLYSALGLGSLDRDIKVIRTVTYFEEI